MIKSTETKLERASQNQSAYNPYHWWRPRFWHGMRFGDWIKLWGRGRFRVRPASFYMAVSATFYTPVNSLLAFVQRRSLGRQLAETKVTHPPLFIIGHWRSGTTFLQELFYLDKQFISPTTYQCFAPEHFLISESWLKILYSHMLPALRPMDNMEVGWDRPQEDEFALLTMGAPTPYFRMAFPNDPPVFDEFLDMISVAPADLRCFEDAMIRFAKALALHSQGKRILFKSPLHTGRVETLKRIFPSAKFIHLTRDPYTMFVSTERLWNALDQVQGLVAPKDQNGSRREYVFHCLEKMYAGFERQRAAIDPADILDVRYEDLVLDPPKQLQRIYSHLGLGDYELNHTAVSAHLRIQQGYRPNRHELSDGLRSEIRLRWAGYFERYGY